MNLLATYLGLVWLRIIGEFADNPEAFKDKDMANKLMNFNKTPKPGQGFLVQINFEQEDLARRLIKAAKFGNATNSSVLSQSPKPIIDSLDNKKNNSQSKPEENKTKDNKVNNIENQKETAKNDQKSDSEQKSSETEDEANNRREKEESYNQSAVTQNTSSSDSSSPTDVEKNEKSPTNNDPVIADAPMDGQDASHPEDSIRNLQYNSYYRLSDHKINISDTAVPEPSNEEFSFLDIINVDSTASNSVNNKTNGTNSDHQDLGNKENKSEANAGGKRNTRKGEKLGKKLMKSVINQSVNAAKTGLQVLFLVGIILLMTSYTIILFKYSMKQFYSEITYAVANGYTEFIEKQGAAKCLPEKRVKLLNMLKWVIHNTKDINETDNVTDVEDYHGVISGFDIKNRERTNYVLAENPSRFKKIRMKAPMEYYYTLGKEDAPYIYFEVETEYLHDSTELIIGYSDKANFSEDNIGFPGQANKSLGFNMKTGEVYLNGTIVHTFNFAREIKKATNKDFTSKFDFNGSFFGIGVNLKNSMGFCTFNGKILNSLSFQTAAEIRYKVYKYKRDDILEDDDQSNIKKVVKLNTLTRKLDLAKEYRDNMKAMPVFITTATNYVPVVYVTGASKFKVNIGGSVFQIKEKILELGLLRKKS